MNKPDPRIPAMLELSELKYQIDDDGDAIVVISGWEEDRSQTVFISSRTYTYDDQEFREVFSPAYTGELPTAKVLAYCLKQNSGVKIGSWKLQIDSDNETVALVFGANVDANASPQRLRQVLLNVAKTTDDLERKLSDQDNF